MGSRVASKRSGPANKPAFSRANKKQKTTRINHDQVTHRHILDVFVCGEGESGELGLGTRKRDGRMPIGVKSPRLNDLANAFDITQIAVGGMHCAAITYDCRIITWGVNDDGALGRNTKQSLKATMNGSGQSKDNADSQGDNEEDDEDDDDLGLNPLECTPATVSTTFDLRSSEPVQVIATDCATFVLTAQGNVYGWGTFKSKNGTFGFSTRELAKGITIQERPLLIPSLKKIKYIAAGVNHVLALDSAGTVFSWGIGENGELGQKDYNSRRSSRSAASALTPRPVFLPGVKIKSITCGHNHSFAIDGNGHVYAWGANNYRQTGILISGLTTEAIVVSLPARVAALDSFSISHIAGGFHHSIACCSDGQVLVWGRCDDSQMGLDLASMPSEVLIRDSQGRPNTLVVPQSIPNFSANFVAAGIDNSLAIAPDGRPFAWGFSQNYRTGLRTEDSVAVPTLITNSMLATRQTTFGACGGQFLVLTGPRPVPHGIKPV